MTRHTPDKPRGTPPVAQALFALVLALAPAVGAQPAAAGRKGAASPQHPVMGAGAQRQASAPRAGAADGGGRDGAGSSGAAAVATPLSEEASVARAVLLFDSGRYAECATQFAELLDPRSARRVSEPALVERARVYRAACLIGLGKMDEADSELRSAIRNNPQMGAPDALAFPQAVIDRFLRVREGLMDEIRREEQQRVEKAQAEAEEAAERAQARRQRTAELEYLASQELIIRQHSRWIAAVPFGAGQFQNGQDGWGWFFLGSELVLGGAVIGAMLADSMLQAKREAEPAYAEDIYETQQSVYGLLIGASYGFLGVASLGILQAQLAYVPDTREVRQRQLPPHLRRPSTSAVSFAPFMLPGGAGFGAAGTF